jgi:hypothetical protein
VKSDFSVRAISARNPRDRPSLQSHGGLSELAANPPGTGRLGEFPARSRSWRLQAGEIRMTTTKASTQG